MRCFGAQTARQGRPQRKRGTHYRIPITKKAAEAATCTTAPQNMELKYVSVESGMFARFLLGQGVWLVHSPAAEMSGATGMSEGYYTLSLLVALALHASPTPQAAPSPPPELSLASAAQGNSRPD